MHYNSNDSYLFLNGKEIHRFEASNKNANFPSRFCLESISNKFDYVDAEEVSLKKTCIIVQSITVLLTDLTY